MYYLLRKQALILLLLCAGAAAQAQSRKTMYREELDYKPFYFGLSLGYASATVVPTKSEYFLANDSILVAEPVQSPGYSLRLLATARLDHRWELRFNPGLILGINRSFEYTLGSREAYEQPTMSKIVQSNIATLPLHVKFNSDRINNFKVYMLGGIKYDFDLASNEKASNAEDLIKFKRTDFGVEFGVGFNFYLPFVTVSPEIKFSNGISDIHARDENLKYSNVMDKLNSRMLFFTIHLEK
jgi:opacity protein-like surface antigen